MTVRAEKQMSDFVGYDATENDRDLKLGAVTPCEMHRVVVEMQCTAFHLYVLLDVFSRYVTGWMVAYRESAELAKRLIEESCKKQDIQPGQLTLHADRGTSMRSKPVALLLADLGVTKTHSRPHVSDDNPFSESQFRTLKYRPEFPDRFGCIQDSRAFSQSFFRWYNGEHRHSGIGLLTPATVHYGQAENVLRQRQNVLDVAYAPEQRQKRGCRGSTELPIVVARRSWREISCGKLGTLIQQTKNSLNFVSTCLRVVDARRKSTLGSFTRWYWETRLCLSIEFHLPGRVIVSIHLLTRPNLPPAVERAVLQ